MSRRKRRSLELDADVDADASPSIEQAEAAAAEAEARAEAARAHAEKLRRQAGPVSPAQPETEAKGRTWSRPHWLRLPPARLLAPAAAIVLICASLTATGYMLWQHHHAIQERQRAAEFSAEFSAAARQTVVTMMSLEPATVRQNLKSVIDSSTGKYKDALTADADDIAKRVEESKVSTKVTVQSVAVESINGDSGVVLVAATTEGSAPNNQKLPPATWRISVSLERDGGQLKTSQFEFVQ